jgi:prostaglandin-H2 D-isomerase / glutathione transferase
MLELEDGTLIAQSSAINLYVGKAGGFYPEDPVLAAKVDMLAAQIEDVRSECTALHR